jgi:hypothetical protein
MPPIKPAEQLARYLAHAGPVLRARMRPYDVEVAARLIDDVHDPATSDAFERLTSNSKDALTVALVESYLEACLLACELERRAT